MVKEVVEPGRARVVGRCPKCGEEGVTVEREGMMKLPLMWWFKGICGCKFSVTGHYMKKVAFGQLGYLKPLCKGLVLTK